jgi:hypothetical protein
VTELVGTHIDVTEQHLAREARQNAFGEIRQSEDQLRLVIDTIPTLVWRAGRHDRFDRIHRISSPVLSTLNACDYAGVTYDLESHGRLVPNLVCSSSCLQDIERHRSNTCDIDCYFVSVL